MHTLNLAKDGNKLLNESCRVLKPGGQLAIIECKKEEMPFGPPLHMRLSWEEIEDEVTQYGFEKIDAVILDSII